MDAPALRKSVHGGVVKEEMQAADTTGDEEGCGEEVRRKISNGRNDLQDDTLKPLSPTQNDFNFNKQEPTICKTEETSSADADLKASSSSAPKEQDDPLGSAKAEMGEVIQENQRLRMYLDRIMKDYRSLQMQFQDIVQQNPEKFPSTTVNTKHKSTDQEPPDFVTLSLGRASGDAKEDENHKISTKKDQRLVDDEEDKQGLALGLDCNFETPHNKQPPAVESSTSFSRENSVVEAKDEAGEAWPPQKMLKTARREEDDTSQQNPPKKARVSVRVRCDTPTMTDGCQWRKYGQKTAKGNPCPRAYYRCTMAPNCPVRKQVQRCAEDMSILTTTYEGTHNHPLPVAATAMASTTSAAATMLLSGSSSSSSSSGSANIGTTKTTNINGLNFYLSDNTKSMKPFYLPNSTTISSSISSPAANSSYSTITLDLTSTSSSSLSSLTRTPSMIPPRYSSTNLNFSSLESSSNSLPISWSNNGVLNYGTSFYNKNQTTNSLSLTRQLPQYNLYQSYLQKNLNIAQASLAPDTIAAATKAITSDPSFQSALAAALSSIIGSANGNAGGLGNQIPAADNKPRQNLKLGTEPLFPLLSSLPSTSNNANKCASSFLDKPPSSSSSSSSQTFSFQPSLPFSTSKSNSTSPGDSGDHIL